ncbi:murein L,D-transpeptidase [Rhodobacteraceae bacterium CCMM004]|nr:murein L,D-transpeptidase [Rhodobacteraceae bacterium CCMM004]
MRFFAEYLPGPSLRAALRPAAAAAVVVCGLAAGPAAATQVTAFKQAVAESASDDPVLSQFYREQGYAPIWVADEADDRARRAAFLSVVAKAPMHGLPAGRYDAATIKRLLASARSERDRGRIEVELSRLLLRFARDLETGILTPARVVPDIKRTVPLRDGVEVLTEFAGTRPHEFLRSLTPGSAEYTRLAREKLALERAIAQGGWGVRLPEGRIEPGQSGPRVVALRDRLTAMGYLRLSATQVYDDAMRRAVEAFQSDHGLTPDGVVGGATLIELNRGPDHRLGQVLVAMERERWLNRDLGERHIWVNLTDFKARIVDRGEVTFETRSVIGKDEAGRETPEFSDEMDHMVINPSWYVPRSIVVNEYLPVLRRNPGALSYMQITDSRGRTVGRSRGFSQYTARTFPYAMRQPPGPRNALGTVKFMFPNKYNIYLHDTPAKNLFSREVRAFSHGCVRLNDPHDFAYTLLAAQEADPEGFFQRILRSGRETRVNMETPLPVHLVYRTAYTKPEGGMQYRRDVYARDSRILAALRRAGVVITVGGS